MSDSYFEAYISPLDGKWHMAFGNSRYMNSPTNRISSSLGKVTQFGARASPGMHDRPQKLNKPPPPHRFLIEAKSTLHPDLGADQGGVRQ